MFRYIVALLVINSYHGCLGVPLPTRPASGPLANLLASLANQCQNAYLTEQIKSKLDDCNVVVPPYNEQQFVCMMFYDINKQLCNAVIESKLTLQNNYTNSLDDEFDVQNTCELARSWNASDIAEYPDYKKNILRVFNVTIGCLKVCGVEDVTSQDTNFYCKYYKWGTDILHPQVSSVSTNEQTGDVLNLGQANLNQENQLEDVKVDVKNNFKPEMENNNFISQVKQTNVISNTSGSSTLVVGDKVVGKTEPSRFQIPEDNVKEVEQKSLDTEGAPEKPPLGITSTNGNTEADNFNNQIPEEEKPPKQIQGEDIIPDKSTQTQKGQKVAVNEENVIVKNNAADPEPDYRDADSEESRDTIDGADETVDDPSIDGEVIGKPGGKQDQKLIQTFDTPKVMGPKVVKIKRKHTTKKINNLRRVGKYETFSTSRPERPIEVTILPTEPSNEFYPNTVPDQFMEDDDHFFPFFFSGVVLAVLLYILYHNKSKVSKVFLGLIVEGRQPGRRRNSRGHAYKRLDTLEQAMSTNSAAPPSKIIY